MRTEPSQALEGTAELKRYGGTWPASSISRTTKEAEDSSLGGCLAVWEKAVWGKARESRQNERAQETSPGRGGCVELELSASWQKSNPRDQQPPNTHSEVAGAEQDCGLRRKRLA